MPASVINIHHGQKYDIYIGRPSRFGNPFSHIPNTLAKFKVATRNEAVEAYGKWILEPEQAGLIAVLPELKDKVLGCFCAPKKCHGDVLVEMVNALDDEGSNVDK